MQRIDSKHNNCHHSSTQIRYLSRRSEQSSSNLALVMVVSMCLGPSAVAVMKGKLQETNIVSGNPEALCMAGKKKLKTIPTAYFDIPNVGLSQR